MTNLEGSLNLMMLMYLIGAGVLLVGTILIVAGVSWLVVWLWRKFFNHRGHRGKRRN